MVNLDTPFAQGDSLIREKPFDVVDECDIEADKEDALDGRIILLEEGGFMDKDECLAAPGRTHNDPVPSVVISGDGLLMVIQDFQPFDLSPLYVFPASFGKFDFDNRKDDLPQVVQVLHVYLEGKQRREFFLEGFQEALTCGIAANV